MNEPNDSALQPAADFMAFHRELIELQNKAKAKGYEFIYCLASTSGKHTDTSTGVLVCSELTLGQYKNAITEMYEKSKTHGVIDSLIESIGF